MSFENWRPEQTDEEREKSETKKAELFAKIKEREEKEHRVFYGDEKGILRTEQPSPEWKELLKSKSKEKVKKIEKGTLVQWVNQGVEQWSEPKRVVGISDDGEYSFFDGSMTGVPVSQLEIIE